MPLVRQKPEGRNMRSWDEMHSHCWGQGRPTYCLLVIHNHFWKHFGISYALVANLQESYTLKIFPTMSSTEQSICKFLINDLWINVLHVLLWESCAHLGPKVLLIVLTEKKLTPWAINFILYPVLWDTSKIIFSLLLSKGKRTDTELNKLH